MRLLVTVDGADALIVGYVVVQNKVHAVVVTNGAICAVELAKIELGRLPKQLRAKVKRKARRTQIVTDTATDLTVQ